MSTILPLNALIHAMKITAEKAMSAGIAFALTIATALPATSQEVSSSQIELRVNEKERLTIPPGAVWNIEVEPAFGELAIGDSEVLDGVPLSDTSLYVLAKKSGVTNLVFYDEKNTFLGEIEFIVAQENDEPKLTSLINRAVPGASISVNVISNRLYLSGLVQKESHLEVVLTRIPQVTR